MRIDSILDEFCEKGKEIAVFNEKTTVSHHQKAWLQAAEQGLHRLVIPQENEGLGFSSSEVISALFGWGKGNKNTGLAFGVGAQLLSCTLPLVKFGHRTQKQLLPSIGSGKCVVAHGMSEPHSGSDAFSMKTTATKENSTTYCINGSKHFTSNSSEADYFLTFAMTNSKLGYFGGCSGFLIPADFEGVTKENPYRKMGLHGCSLGGFHLNQVRVPTDNLLGNEGIGSTIFNTSMMWERLGLTALHLGWCAQLSQVLINYFQQERKLNSYREHQAQKHQFLRLVALSEALESQLFALAPEVDQPKKNTLFKICRLKAVASEHLQDFSKFGCEIITTFNRTDNWIHQLFLDAAATKIYSGSSEIQLNLSGSEFRL